MALKSYGIVTVTTATSIVRCTINETTPSARVGVQSFMVQALPANAGLVYVGTANMVVSSGVGVLAVLPKPTSTTTGPFASVSFSIVNAPAGLNLADIYLDVSNGGDGAFVSATVQ
jgi:hypothetical protein